MFVGQAPGAEEDRRGQCWVGPAGQLLQQAIDEYGFQASYRTNLVKCFPPGDRDPNAKEIRACQHYLGEEIRQVKPKLAVAVGAISLKRLTGRTGVFNWNGRVAGKLKDGTPVMGLLHPAFVLRYPENLVRFEAGCREIKWALHPEEKPALPSVDEVTDGVEFDRRIRNMKGPVAWDLETSGKFKCDGGYLRTVAFSDGDTAFWIRYEAGGWDGVLRRFLQSDVAKAGHNVAFETRWSIDEFGFEPENFRYDTMLMHHLIDENASHGLDVVAGQMLGAPQWDVWPELREQGLDYATAPVESVGPYNAIDAYWTARLVPELAKMMTPDLIKLYEGLVLQVGKVCARLESRGTFVDRTWALAVNDKFLRKQRDLEEGLCKSEEVAKLDERLTAEKKVLNFNSSHQMGKLFFGVMGLKSPEKTETGKPSTREAALKKIESDSPILAQYLEWKNLQTLRNNFLEKFPRFTNDDGLMHPSFNPAFVVTGRLSVTNPPAQAIPEDPLVRGMISSRFNGGKILALDYKQLEIRLVASESGEEKLIEAIKEGEDLHDLTAKLVFGDSFTKRERSIAKRINFGIVYGVSAHTLAREFTLKVEEAERIMEKFKRAYPAIFVWMKKQHDFIKRNGWIASRFGRVRRLPEIRQANDWQRERILRQAGNFPIASAGADITNTAVVLLDAFLRGKGAKSLVFLQIHDSVLIDLDPSEAGGLPDRCVQVMEDKVQGRCPWLKVPLKVDVAVADRWGGAVEVT